MSHVARADARSIRVWLATTQRSLWATHLAVRADMRRMVERAAALGIVDEDRHGGQLLLQATRDPRGSSSAIWLRDLRRPLM